MSSGCVEVLIDDSCGRSWWAATVFVWLESTVGFLQVTTLSACRLPPSRSIPVAGGQGVGELLLLLLLSAALTQPRLLNLCRVTV